MSAPRSNARTWVNLHSGNVERPREVGQSATVRGEFLLGAGGRGRRLLDLRINLLHQVDHSLRKREEG